VVAAVLFSTGGAAIKYNQLTSWQVACFRAAFAAGALWIAVPDTVQKSVYDSEIAPNLPVIHGDPVLLEWAVEVLTKNAIDALAGRGGRIRVAAAVAEGDGVVVSVTDDGPGVPRELRSRIFEPGFSTKKSGWGIGLSLTKRIVEENHEGRLVLANTEQGARFEIILH